MPPAPAPTPAHRRLRFPPEFVTRVAAAAMVGSVLLVWLVAAVFDPTPDKRIVMATGPEQGAYAEFARPYVELLRANGVTLVLRSTQGSTENLSLLRDPRSGVQVAFVQGGSEPAPDPADSAPPVLVSLGSVAYEPLWLFHRADSVARLPGREAPTRLSQMAGWSVNIGPAGGGTGPLVRQLAAAGGLPEASLHSGPGQTVNGVVDLVQGRDDVLALVSAPDAPFVQYLLRTPGVRLLDFVQAEAFARRFSFLHALDLPRGLIDPAADQPPQDMHLVAVTASLVARADLHPALVELLVQAAARVHGQAGWFHRAGEFPSLAAPIAPLSAEAERFHRSGPPWLQHYLPFWLANFFDRMWIVLLPLVAVLLPLSRVLPPLVDLRLRSRVFRWYGQLRALEEASPRRPVAELLRELDAIAARVAEVRVPLSYADELYALRSHIAMVRRGIEQRRLADAGS